MECQKQQPATAHERRFGTGNAGLIRRHAEYAPGIEAAAVSFYLQARGFGLVRCLQPCAGGDNAAVGKRVGHNAGRCGRQAFPVHVLEQQPVVGRLGMKHDAGVPTLGFYRCETHDRECQDDQCRARQRRPQRAPAQIAHPQKKSRHKGGS